MLSILDLSAEAWTAIATAGGALAVIIAAWIAKRRKPGKIELVGVSISDKTVEIVKTIVKFPVVNVMVKNVGDKVSVINSAEFDVRKVWHLKLQFHAMLALPLSGEYDMAIDPEKEPPYTERVIIPHVLRPDEADRFNFTFSLNPMTCFESIYHLTIKIIYDENQGTAIKNIILILPDMSASHPYYFIDEFNELWKQHNEKEWNNNELKIAEDSLFNKDYAKKADEYNRESLYEVSDIRGEFSNRASELTRRVIVAKPVENAQKGNGAQIDSARKLSIADAASAISVTRGTLKGYISAGRIRKNSDGTIDTGELQQAGFIIRNWPPRS